MAKTPSTKARSKRAKSPPVRKPSKGPELEEVLGRFSDARSFLECATRLLEDWDGETTRGPGDESVCLRHGLDLLKTVYRDLDMAIMALNRERRQT